MLSIYTNKLADEIEKTYASFFKGAKIDRPMLFGELYFHYYCMKNNIRIPEELSVVSFDNITFSDLCGISLTTIDHHVEDLCRRAVDMMLYHIDHQNDDKVFHEMLEPTLIVRKTTAPPCCG